MLFLEMNMEQKQVYLLSPLLMIIGIALYIILGEILKELILFALWEPYLTERFGADSTEYLVEISEYILLATLLIPIAWFFVIRPVNHHNQQQRQLLNNIDQQNETLRQEIEERRQLETALRKARDEAEHTALAKAQFLAVMSHEIRNPLTAVIGASELLAAQKTLPNQEHLIGTLSQASQSLLGTINSILDFSRIDASDNALNPVPTEIGPFCQSTIKILRPLAERKGLAIDVRVDPKIPRLLTFDSVRLRQVLVNLLSNAVKFTERGSVRLEIEQLSVSNEHHDIKFSVHDTGPGLTKEEQGALFDAYTQVDEDHASEGSGLGLWICQRLARLMNTQILIDSTPGQGSCLHMTVTLQEADGAVVSGKHKTIEEPITQKETGLILIVDDQTTNRDVLSSMLELLGYQFAQASNGQEAIEACRQNMPSIIFMDIQMPILDGIAATKSIREMSNKQTLPWIIATSGTDSKELSEIAHKAGINDVLSKPYGIDKLKASIQAAHIGLDAEHN